MAVMRSSNRNHSFLKRLRNIYAFLEDSRNRKWNREFQQKEFRLVLGGCQSANQRLSKLLHQIANTQARPSIDRLAEFWKSHEGYRGKTLHEFNNYLNKFSDPSKYKQCDDPWNRLFYGLRGQGGWGDKTSALFVKSAIQIHRGPEDLHFFEEAAGCAQKKIGAPIFLPVDAVISYIFQRLEFESPTTFKAINYFLHQEGYDAEAMITWDDLWFWGFFTQRTDGRKRTLEWNSEKFWAQFSSPKKDEPEVKKRAEKFIGLIEV